MPIKESTVGAPEWGNLEQHPRDPGAAARDKMRARKERMERLKYQFRRFVLRVIILAITLIVGAAVVLYPQVRDAVVVSTVTDYRDCRWPIGKIELTGKRAYTYPFIDVLGMRWIDKSRITESTSIDLPRDATTVISIKEDDNWRGEYQSEGAGGTMKLTPGRLYVVVSGKNFGAFDHESFCKQHATPTKKED